MDDFLTDSHNLSNIYAQRMHIMITGEHSYQLRVVSKDVLFDRITFISMTHISYKEYRSLTNGNLDDYLKTGIFYGFKTYKDTLHYIENAIVDNLCSVMRDMKYCKKVPELYDLYLSGEISGLILTVIMNSVYDMFSNILKRVSIEDMLRQLRFHGFVVDEEGLIERLNNLNTQINCCRFTVDGSTEKQIIQYLNEIGVFQRGTLVVPGIAYSFAFEVLRKLMRGNDRWALQVISDILMLDFMDALTKDIIMYETQSAVGEGQALVKEQMVYNYSGEHGEFDMVIAKYRSGEAKLYKISRSGVRSDRQKQYLTNEIVLADFKKTEYPRIAGKYVLYMGETVQDGEVQYINIEEYLTNL